MQRLDAAQKPLRFCDHFCGPALVRANSDHGLLSFSSRSLCVADTLFFHIFWLDRDCYVCSFVGRYQKCVGNDAVDRHPA